MAARSIDGSHGDTRQAHGRLVSARGLAQLLAVPVGQIYRLASHGILPRYRIGHRTTRYDVDEVLSILREAPSPGTDP
jgi:predicted DNA-binding transcriptional regulator AlpA